MDSNNEFKEFQYPTSDIEYVVTFNDNKRLILWLATNSWDQAWDWIKNTASLNDMEFIMYSSKTPNDSIVFRRYIRCKMNQTNKSSSANTNCSSRGIVVCHANESDWFKNKYATMVDMNYSHNHLLQVMDGYHLKKRVLAETQRRVVQLLKICKSPVAARERLKEELSIRHQEKYSQVAQDNSLLPNLQYFYYQNRKRKIVDQKCGESSSPSEIEEILNDLQDCPLKLEMDDKNQPMLPTDIMSTHQAEAEDDHLTNLMDTYDTDSTTVVSDKFIVDKIKTITDILTQRVLSDRETLLSGIEYLELQVNNCRGSTALNSYLHCNVQPKAIRRRSSTYRGSRSLGYPSRPIGANSTKKRSK